MFWSVHLFNCVMMHSVSHWSPIRGCWELIEIFVINPVVISLCTFHFTHLWNRDSKSLDQRTWLLCIEVGLPSWPLWFWPGVPFHWVSRSALLSEAECVFINLRALCPCPFTTIFLGSLCWFARALYILENGSSAVTWVKNTVSFLTDAQAAWEPVL